MPTVHNRNESAAIPGDAVFVGRPSKFGNPFVIGAHGSRDEVIALFREWLTDTDHGRAVVQAAAVELEGKDLICFCAPEACHADILLEIANRD